MIEPTIPRIMFAATGEYEDCNYVCCPLGHKLGVVWSASRQMFCFTCDTCEINLTVGLGPHGACFIVRVPAEIAITKVGPCDVS